MCPDCDLCEAARLTTWYYEDDTCWIAECEACYVPMVVWRAHGTEPPAAEVAHMQRWLGIVADDHFGTTQWFLDDNMRQIPEHFHAHARRKPPWMSS
ncbi:MAG: hypothetical protein V3V01_14905 [Acidimicrobiales bacterium]